jgi:hypothetical protein
MMDKATTRAVEEFVHAGYDLDAVAILLCESDGTPEEVAEEIGRMTAVLEKAGASGIRISKNETERLTFWSGRKNAFPAAGRIAADYYCMDGTIPRRHIATLLRRIQEMEKKYRLGCLNVFHAGDGNMHPLILFNGADMDEWHRAEEFGTDILEACVELGGTITGEHGVGIEKINSMCVQFSTEERDAFRKEVVALGEEIRELDLDVSMPDADPAGRAAYERAHRQPHTGADCQSDVQTYHLAHAATKCASFAISHREPHARTHASTLLYSFALAHSRPHNAL